MTLIRTVELKPYDKNNEIFENLPKMEYNALLDDIKKNGIKTELHVTPDNIVLCGHQRLRVAVEIGLEFVPCKIIEGLTDDDLIQEYVIKDNLLRRHLSPDQKAPLVKRLYDLMEKRIGSGRRTDLEPLEQDVPKVDIYQQLADEIGQSRMSAVRYVQVEKAKEAEPEKYSGMKVTQVLRQIRVDKQKEEIKELKPIQGTFNLIVIDPPWPIPNHDTDGFRGGAPYPIMSIDEIKSIKLPTADDAIIWVWAIDSFLKEAIEVIESWGFERKATLVWDKQKIGLGKWLRNQHEYCFLCIKGKPIFFGENFRSVLSSPRLTHSEKPNEFYELIERASPYEKKLDYFSRKKRNGWVVYGDEINE